MLQAMKPGTMAIESVAFSADGRYIAYGGQNGTIMIHKLVLETLEPQLRLQQSSSLQGHTGAVTSLSFAHDGKSLVSTASDHNIRIWDIRAGTSKLLRDTNEISVLSKASWPQLAACSPYNDAIVGGFSDGKVLLWETITGGHYRVLKGHTDCILSIAFSQNGSKIATASKDGTVRVWDTKLCVLQQTLLSHFDDSFQSVIFSPDDTHIVSGSFGNTICFWDAVIATAAKTRTSSYVAATNIGKEFGRFESPFIIANNEELMLAMRSSQRVQLWAEELNETSFALEPLQRSLVCCTAFSAARQAIAIGSRDEVVSLWDIRTGQEHESISLHDGGGLNVLGNMIHNVAFSRDGKMLASGSGTGSARDPGCDDSVRVWDLEAWREVAVFRGHNGPILALAFSSDNQHLVVVRRNTAPNGNPSSYGIYQYEVVLCHMSGSQRLLFKTGSPHITVYALTLSPDASLLAVASTTGYVDIWDLFGRNSGDQRFRITESVVKCRLEAPKHPLICFSPDSRKLAVGSHSDWRRGKVWLWDLEARALCQVLEGHKDFILAIEISADCKRLMSVSQDGMVLVWAIDVPPMWETAVSSQLCLHSRPEERRTPKASLALDTSNSWRISEDRHWIAWRGRNVFWLPPVYRAMDITATEKEIVFRSQSGELTDLRFSGQVYI
jgi:WD40 repeat protein